MTGAADAPAWPQLRQEYLADLIEESLRSEHEFLRGTHVLKYSSSRIPWWRRRKPRIPDGLFAHFADQAAWHVIRPRSLRRECPGRASRRNRRCRATTRELDDALDRIDYVRYEINGWNSRDQHLKTAIRIALGDPTWLGNGPIPKGKPRPKTAAGRRIETGQKSPEGVARPPLVTVQQETPPPPAAPNGERQ